MAAATIPNFPDLYAWLGEDEFGRSGIGLKQAVVPAGIVPMVSIERKKMEGHWEQAEEQAKEWGKRISLVRYVAVEVVRETK